MSRIDANRQRVRSAEELETALDRGQLVPFFQPVVDIDTGLPQQMEALLRWQHPVLGTLPPSSFLPAIEDDGLVIPVARVVLDAALGQLVALADDGVHLPGGVAVNVASGQLARPGLAHDVSTALDRHHLAGDRLTLEITETTALSDVGIAHRELSILRDLGVQVALDDYGVGWSSMTRLAQLPVDALKLDRALVSSVLDNPTAAAVVASSITLAETLDLVVTAEGIESQDVAAHLAAAGCRRGQGWLYGAAVDGDIIGLVLSNLGARAL